MSSAYPEPVVASSSGSSPEDVQSSEEVARSASVASKQHSEVAAGTLGVSRLCSASTPGKRLRDGELAADESDATGVASTKKSKRATISFGAVEILTHAPALDGCKVPSDGQAPMGLGKLETVELRRIASFDLERQAQREGTHLIPASERRNMLRTIALHRTASIDKVENEIARLREEKPTDFVPPIPAPPPAQEVGIVELWA